VATVSSLGGSDIETYANQLFRRWGLGDRVKNNGVLLLVAPNERRVRIEVGYGLEGVLTDAISNVIIFNAMQPRFKAGDFDGGVERGVDDVITALTTDSSDWQKRSFSRLISLDASTADEALHRVGIPIFLLLVMLILGLANWLSERLARLLGIQGSGSGSGWSGDGGWSGGGWSGGGGGGGFSGGGGSSGGGGASGEW
jgi:uncharacterized protein